MRIDNKIYFSPNIRFTDIDWDDKCKLIDAFKDRVEGFYLKPAKILNKERYGFAVFADSILTPLYKETPIRF